MNNYLRICVQELIKSLGKRNNGQEMKIGKGLLMTITFLVLSTAIFFTLSELFAMDVTFSLIDSVISSLLLTFAMFLGYGKQNT